MKKLSTILLIYFISTYNLVANDPNDEVSISGYKVERRSEQLCKVNGNVWGNCAWTLKFNITNNSNYNIDNFCTVLELNEKKYRLCYSKKNKSNVSALGKKYIFINLNKYMGIDNNSERPNFKMISFKPNFKKT